MRKQLIYASLILTFLVFTIGIVGAIEKSIEPIQQNECAYLKQTCANCTFVNITSVASPNGQQLLGNVLMTQTGTEYNYTFCSTAKMGKYIYNTLGNPDGTITTEPVTFEVTADGNQYRAFPLIFIFAIIGFALLIFNKMYIGRLHTNILSVFGAIILLICGVITLYPGFNYTNYSTLEGLGLGCVLIGIGVVIIYREAEGIF